MIKGLTHDENGVLNRVTKYKGKISTGYAPGEGPNKENHPTPAGFFRILQEVTKSQRAPSGKVLTIKSWILYEKMQNLLEKSNEGDKMPRSLEIVLLDRTVESMWESCLAMFSSSDGLVCKSHGEGTVARFLQKGSGERVWVEREFDGVKGCPYKNCPDFKAGKCKVLGLLKCWPSFDLSPNPYRLETRSINTIIGIESALTDMSNLLQAAHAVKQQEASKELPFDGFFGVRAVLLHQKIKSGGREVFVTNLYPTPEFNNMVMEPIKRWMERRKKTASLPGAAGSMSILDLAGRQMLENKAGSEGGIPGPDDGMDIADQQAIAEQFGADADDEIISAETVVEDAQETPPEATEAAQDVMQADGK